MAVCYGSPRKWIYHSQKFWFSKAGIYIRLLYVTKFLGDCHKWINFKSAVVLGTTWIQCELHWNGSSTWKDLNKNENNVFLFVRCQHSRILTGPLLPEREGFPTLWITHSTCVGLLIIMGSWNCDSIFLIRSQKSNPMNLSWLGFFFFNCCMWGKQREATLKNFNILHKEHALLHCPHVHFPASWRFYVANVTYFFSNKGRIETPTREGWAESVLGISSRAWEPERLLTGSFPAHWHGHKAKQHIHFVQFALPSHMELVHVKGC